MLTKDLRKLPEGSYVLVKFYDEEPETVRLRGVREPSAEELSFGHTSMRIDVRRFLTGGWVDTWVIPRDVVGVAEPDEGVLRIIAYVEENVGEKKPPKIRWNDNEEEDADDSE